MFLKNIFSYLSRIASRILNIISGKDKHTNDFSNKSENMNMQKNKNDDNTINIFNITNNYYEDPSQKIPLKISSTESTATASVPGIISTEKDLPKNN